MKILKYMIYMALFVFLCSCGFVAGGYMWFLEQSKSPDGSRNSQVKISHGSNTRQIGFLLKQKRIIRSALLFRFYIRLLAVDNILKPGLYNFSSSDSLDQVIKKLLKGTSTTVTVTIPEGKTNKEIAGILESAGICSSIDFLEAVSDPNLLGEVFKDWSLIPAAEGLAFPETYQFNKPTTAKVVAKKMLKLSNHQISQIFSSPLPGGLSQYEGCILASIVEREAALGEDRPIVSSVFYNRLKKGIKLESCATVQYALPQWKDRLLFEDLKIDSPYNTYLNLGLPPTPISNFGRKSLLAVAQPEDTEFLYFVSDGNRGHVFSKTLREHNRSKKEFFKNRRNSRKRNEKPN
jgi:UPF0755 protein